RLHPRPRLLRRTQDGISARMPNETDVFGVAGINRISHIRAREVTAHVELTRIARGGNGLRYSEKLHFVAESNAAARAREQGCAGVDLISVEFNGPQL